MGLYRVQELLKVVLEFLLDVPEMLLELLDLSLLKSPTNRLPTPLEIRRSASCSDTADGIRFLWFHVGENSIFDCVRESDTVSRAEGWGLAAGCWRLPTLLISEIKPKLFFRIQKFRDQHVAPTQPTRWVGEFPRRLRLCKKY